MIATHILAASGGMGVFVAIALAIRYPLLRLALVMAAGTATAYFIVTLRAVLA
jgi:hypothetical protein